MCVQLYISYLKSKLSEFLYYYTIWNAYLNLRYIILNLYYAYQGFTAIFRMCSISFLKYRSERSINEILKKCQAIYFV